MIVYFFFFVDLRVRRTDDRRKRVRGKGKKARYLLTLTCPGWYGMIVLAFHQRWRFALYPSILDIILPDAMDSGRKIEFRDVDPASASSS